MTMKYVINTNEREGATERERREVDKSVAARSAISKQRGGGGGGGSAMRSKCSFHVTKKLMRWEFQICAGAGKSLYCPNGDRFWLTFFDLIWKRKRGERDVHYHHQSRKREKPAAFNTKEVEDHPSVFVMFWCLWARRRRRRRRRKEIKIQWTIIFFGCNLRVDVCVVVVGWGRFRWCWVTWQKKKKKPFKMCIQYLARVISSGARGGGGGHTRRWERQSSARAQVFDFINAISIITVTPIITCSLYRIVLFYRLTAWLKQSYPPSFFWLKNIKRTSGGGGGGGKRWWWSIALLCSRVWWSAIRKHTHRVPRNCITPCLLI